MSAVSTTFELELPGFYLSAGLNPWDEEVFGYSVAQIDQIQVQDATIAANGWRPFHEWLSGKGVRVVSCRLPMERLHESMFLERSGFRFIEVVLHPFIDNLSQRDIPRDHLKIEPANQGDLSCLIAMAETAFGHERYHIDPRLNPRLGDKRYGRWVRTAASHPSQQLLKIQDGTKLIGFFVIERDDIGAFYWHLNAIAPDFHGRGYGRRVWQAMLRRHSEAGAASVSTTISARNIAALNLYAGLGFRFLPPEMTFHWVSSDP